MRVYLSFGCVHFEPQGVACKTTGAHSSCRRIVDKSVEEIFDDLFPHPPCKLKKNKGTQPANRAQEASESKWKLVSCVICWVDGGGYVSKRTNSTSHIEFGKNPWRNAGQTLSFLYSDWQKTASTATRFGGWSQGKERNARSTVPTTCNSYFAQTRRRWEPKVCHLHPYG